MLVRTRPLLGAVLTATLAIVVACGVPARPSAGSPSPTMSPIVSAISSPGPTNTATTTPAPTTATSAILRQTLTDVRTGERFTLGGFGGKTVIVQGMAVW